jgi:hypothetical protein
MAEQPTSEEAPEQQPEEKTEEKAVTLDEAAKALLDKLQMLTAKTPLHTGYGYLHIITEGELEPELSTLAYIIYPPPVRAEEPASEEAPAEDPAVAGPAEAPTYQ